MLVVDLLHEFELGVWKAVFAQLLRMLECLEENKVHELDRRSVPVNSCDVLLGPCMTRCKLFRLCMTRAEILMCAMQYDVTFC
jgi:hypothetical protein